MPEPLIAKERVVGSNPIFRSIHLGTKQSPLTLCQRALFCPCVPVGTRLFTLVSCWGYQAASSIAIAFFMCSSSNRKPALELTIFMLSLAIVVKSSFGILRSRRDEGMSCCL